MRRKSRYATKVNYDVEVKNAILLQSCMLYVIGWYFMHYVLYVPAIARLHAGRTAMVLNLVSNRPVPS